MSRRKDRERVEEVRRQYPDYPGFRGYGREPIPPGRMPLEIVTCSVCGRKRNVAVGAAPKEGEAYVCLACREESGELLEREGGRTDG